MALPRLNEIVASHNLEGAPYARRPDPHGFYDRGQTPPPCPCHPLRLGKHNDGPTVELSPLWQRALQKTFRVPFPDSIPICAIPE